MKVRRSRLEMALEILSAVAGGVGMPTRIMYMTRISYESIKEILSGLVGLSLVVVRKEGGRSRYEVTDEGLRVLRYFEADESVGLLGTARGIY